MFSRACHMYCVLIDHELIASMVGTLRNLRAIECRSDGFQKNFLTAGGNELEPTTDSQELADIVQSV